MAGGRLQGRIDARADLGAQVGAPAARRSEVHARRRPAGLPREVRIAGNASLVADRVKTDGLTVSVTGATATAQGLGRTSTRSWSTLGLGVVGVRSRRACSTRWGCRRSPRARASTRRPTAASRIPRVSGDASVQGVNAGGRKLPELVAKFGLERGDAAPRQARRARCSAASIDGHGTVQLWEKRASKPLQVAGRRREAGCCATSISRRWRRATTSAGRLSLHAEAQRPARRASPRASRSPPARRSRCSATKYSLGPVEVAAGDRQVGKSRTDCDGQGAAPQAQGGRRAGHPGQGRPRPPGSRSRRRARQAAARGPARHRDVGRARSAASPARSCTSAAGPIAPS